MFRDSPVPLSGAGVEVRGLPLEALPVVDDPRESVLVHH